LLVRSPQPASLDLDAAYRLLQHDTTREHDSRLIDPRPSGEAVCCAPFAFATRLPPCGGQAFRRPLFRAPSGAAASHDGLATTARREASERRTRISRAPLLETLPSTLASSSTCCRGGLECLRRRRVDQGLRSSDSPRRAPLSRRPRVLSIVRVRAGIAPDQPPVYRGRVRRHVALGKECIAPCEPAPFLRAPRAPSPDEPSAC